jgi:hypothetical protein
MKDPTAVQRPAWEPPWIGRVVLGHGFGRQGQASPVVAPPDPPAIEAPVPGSAI